MMTIKNIAVFCGAKTGIDPIYVEATKQLAQTIANANCNIVYGGTSIGLMGVLANEALAHHAEVIGIIPDHLVDVEIAHRGLTELHIVQSMAKRKALILEKSDAFIMIPGGIGSLDEFFEVLTLYSLNRHQKPIGILNTNDYYRPLLSFLNKGMQEGFITDAALNHVLIETDPDKLISRFTTHDELNLSPESLALTTAT